jgi:hypothetical protein
LLYLLIKYRSDITHTIDITCSFFSSFLRRQESFYELGIARKAPDEEDDRTQSMQRHKTFNPHEIPACAGMTVIN